MAGLKAGDIIRGMYEAWPIKVRDYVVIDLPSDPDKNPDGSNKWSWKTFGYYLNGILGLLQVPFEKEYPYMTGDKKRGIYEHGYGPLDFRWKTKPV